GLRLRRRRPRRLQLPLLSRTYVTRRPAATRSRGAFVPVRADADRGAGTPAASSTPATAAAPAASPTPAPRARRPPVGEPGFTPPSTGRPSPRRVGRPSSAHAS